MKCFNCHRHIFGPVIQVQECGIGRQSPLISCSELEETGKKMLWCGCLYQGTSEKLESGLEIGGENTFPVLLFYCTSCT